MQIGIEKIGLGVVKERFEQEFSKIVENILDPNTEAKPMRKLTVDFKIKPDQENREMCSLEVTVVPKLAPARAYESAVRVGINHVTGEIDAAEITTSQGELFPDKKPRGNVTSIDAAATGGA